MDQAQASPQTAPPRPLDFVEEDIEGIGHVSHHRCVSYLHSSNGFQAAVPDPDGNRAGRTKFFSCKKYGPHEALAKANEVACDLELDVLTAPHPPRQPRKPPEQLTRWNGGERAAVVSAMAAELRRLEIDTPNAKQFKRVMTIAQEQCLADGRLKPDRRRNPESFEPSTQFRVKRQLLALMAQREAAATVVQEAPAEQDDPPPPQVEQPAAPTAFDYEREDPVQYSAEARADRHMPFDYTDERYQYGDTDIVGQLGNALGKILATALGHPALKRALRGLLNGQAHGFDERAPAAANEDYTEQDRRIDERVMRGAPEASPEPAQQPGIPPPPAAPPKPTKAELSALQLAMEDASHKKLTEEKSRHEHVEKKYEGPTLRVMVCGLHPEQRQIFKRMFDDAFKLELVHPHDDNQRQIRETVQSCDYVFSTLAQTGGMHVLLKANVGKKKSPTGHAMEERYIRIANGAHLVRDKMLALANGNQII